MFYPLRSVMIRVVLEKHLYTVGGNFSKSLERLGRATVGISDRWGVILAEIETETPRKYTGMDMTAMTN